jgi:hypothetical protein
LLPVGEGAEFVGKDVGGFGAEEGGGIVCGLLVFGGKFQDVLVGILIRAFKYFETTSISMVLAMGTSPTEASMFNASLSAFARFKA